MDRLVYVQLEFSPRPLAIFGRELRGDVEYRPRSARQMRLVVGAMQREHQRKTVDVIPYLYGLTAYRVIAPTGQ